MFQLLDIAKNFLQQANIPADGTLADFTMGNGHDTLYLASLVPQGVVYAFDIQPEAVENTRARLAEAGLHNAKLILDSHANAINYISAPLDAGMFNLGYRPGGDKSVHTMHESTLKAVTDAISLLKPGGILVISVYRDTPKDRPEGRNAVRKACRLRQKEILRFAFSFGQFARRTVRDRGRKIRQG